MDESLEAWRRLALLRAQRAPAIARHPGGDVRAEKFMAGVLEGPLRGSVRMRMIVTPADRPAAIPPLETLTRRSSLAVEVLDAPSAPAPTTTTPCAPFWSSATRRSPSLWHSAWVEKKPGFGSSTGNRGPTEGRTRQALFTAGRAARFIPGPRAREPRPPRRPAPGPGTKPFAARDLRCVSLKDRHPLDAAWVDACEEIERLAAVERAVEEERPPR